jgi:eukaryotic-like serine/threonine-protein kinase
MAIPFSEKRFYEFGPYHLDPSGPLLLRSGELVTLPPKTLEILAVLVDQHGTLVSKDDLLGAVWPGTFVEESNLTHHISLLRKALGNVEDGQPYIETIPKRGYRFAGLVREAVENGQPVSDSLPEASPPKPSRRWLIATALAAGLTVALGVGWRLWHSTAPPNRDLVLTRLTSDSGLTTDPVLFAPGKLLAYASDRSGDGNLDIWVQQLGGGTPVRVTKDAADERWPTFSPDGTRIAYRTERNGGGIEVVPALGGEPQRIADRGQRPRFSPDGNWIAYWTGPTALRRDPSRPSTDKVFVTPAAGGAPKQIPREFQNARYPVWSPDSRRLLFAGWRDTSLPPDQGYDWWVAPLDGGPAVKTGAADILRRAGLASFAVPGAWTGNQVVFSARLGDSTSLWQVEISPRTWQISDAPTRLTTSGLDAEPVIAADGSLVYANLMENADVWNLPLDANRGRITGSFQPLTRNAASDAGPSLSLDGRTLVFISNRTGNGEAWLKNLDTGLETAISSLPFQKLAARISRDGSKAAYAANGTIYIVSIGTDGRAGVPAKVCDGCGGLADWSPDGKGLLLTIGNQPNQAIGWVDVASGKHAVILSDPGLFVTQPNFSADGRWIAFNASNERGQNNIYLVASRGAAAIERREWTTIIEDGYLARWSPDGSRLYFFSNRDGSGCIWTQPVNPATKQPVGAPQELYHLHDGRHALLGYPAFAFSVARDKLVFPLRELTGNIWMAKPESRQ